MAEEHPKSMRLDKTTKDMINALQDDYKTNEETIRDLVWRELCERIDSNHYFVDKYREGIEKFIIEHWKDIGYGPLPPKLDSPELFDTRQSAKRRERLARIEDNKKRKSYARMPNLPQDFSAEKIIGFMQASREGKTYHKLEESRLTPKEKIIIIDFLDKKGSKRAKSLVKDLEGRIKKTLQYQFDQMEKEQGRKLSIKQKKDFIENLL